MPERTLTERRALAYDPRFDLNAITNLQALKPQLPREEYSRRLNQLLDRTRTNLVTNLGERFNVEISTTTYLQNPQGKLINRHHDEPFEEIIKRGVDYRLRNGNPKDTTREEAELLGFLRAQELLRGNQTVVIISPRGESGSDYQHNFFDIYCKKEGCVTVSRYSSKSDWGKFYNAAKIINPNLPAPLKPTDSFFLSHPLATEKPASEIVKILNLSDKTMDSLQFQKLALEDCGPAINLYLQKLRENPLEQDLIRFYNFILKVADLAASQDPYSPNNPARLLTIKKSIANFGIEVVARNIGVEQIRQVQTGCGSQGGLETNRNNSPWSVSEFGNNNDQEWFQCPKCRYKANGPVGNTCPGCGLTKEQYAQEAGIACA